jgi:hypothetical protein
MTIEKDDDWLEVLAGKKEPQDAQTRQAAALRNYFELQDQHAPTLDEATQRRILNALEATGVFAPPATVKTEVGTGLVARVLQWLFPQGHANRGRYAGVALAVMAAVMLPYLLHSPVGEEDPYGVKSFPKGMTDPSAIVIDTAQPEQLADQLVAALSRHGVAAELRTDAIGQWVQAQIPAERIATVQADLASLGVVAPQDGRLMVQFRRQR